MGEVVAVEEEGRAAVVVVEADDVCVVRECVVCENVDHDHVDHGYGSCHCIDRIEAYGAAYASAACAVGDQDKLLRCLPRSQTAIQ